MTVVQHVVRESLAIPDEAWNHDGVATIVVTGASYGGGTWVLNAISTHLPKDQAEAIGCIETADAPRRPDLAVEAATAWIAEECNRNGWLMGPVRDMNGHYGPDEAPFFAGACYFIAKPALQEQS